MSLSTTALTSNSISVLGFSVHGGILSHLDNNNALGFPTYEKRSYDDGGSKLTTQNYGQKLSNIADKYRDLLYSEEPYQEWFY